ncbi:hypothetical protein ACIXFG_21460 [Bacteroides fragilis]
MVVGVDVHVTTAPPFNPIHPYIGMVMDPADYIPFLGTNVSVNGLKRGVSDTGGMIIPLMHIPLAGPFAMASMIGHESMNFFASQTVFCDGSRMSPKGHMVMTCNDVGIPLSAGIGKNKAGKTRLIPSLFAPTSFSLPVPTVSGLDVIKGRDGVFVVRGDTDLDISDRIVGSGKIKCRG